MDFYLPAETDDRQGRRGSPSKRWAIRAVALAFAFLALGAAGCGSSTTSSDEPSGVGGQYTEDDPEYQLAVVDDRPPSDKNVRPHARLLDALERSCQERRSRLADSAVNGVESLREEGIKRTNLELLRSYRNAVSGSRLSGRECRDRFVGVLVILISER